MNLEAFVWGRMCNRVCDGMDTAPLSCHPTATKTCIATSETNNCLRIALDAEAQYHRKGHAWSATLRGRLRADARCGRPDRSVRVIFPYTSKTRIWLSTQPFVRPSPWHLLAGPPLTLGWPDIEGRYDGEFRRLDQRPTQYSWKLPVGVREP
jgi:hypothetical protein